LTTCCLVLLCRLRHDYDDRILAEASHWLEAAIGTASGEEDNP